jgi:hypothetical protein
LGRPCSSLWWVLQFQPGAGVWQLRSTLSFYTLYVDQWWALANMVMNLSSIKGREFLTIWVTADFSGELFCMVLVIYYMH